MTQPESPKTPFFGAALDPERSTASGILLNAALGIGVTNPEVVAGWVECVEEVDKLGPEHGVAVLKMLNVMAESGGLSLLLTKSTIGAFRALHPPNKP